MSELLKIPSESELADLERKIADEVALWSALDSEEPRDLSGLLIRNGWTYNPDTFDWSHERIGGCGLCGGPESQAAAAYLRDEQREALPRLIDSLRLLLAEHRAYAPRFRYHNTDSWGRTVLCSCEPCKAYDAVERALGAYTESRR